ncbi:hypothetical protein C4900_06940 [Acidiferrobacter thiooxydans]|uniref:Uncharacterized protein n=1 Tax=Acidiferrobacter thiooxydans TaxID=163359 RepID=A0A368HLR8_9GAMM|nr:hypothetical protein C4900_06940 [Acidiferrobacter thiooxydans]
MAPGGRAAERDRPKPCGARKRSDFGGSGRGVCSLSAKIPLALLLRYHGRALRTLQLPVAEKLLATKDKRKDEITVLLDKRAAVAIVPGNTSTDASNDLERVILNVQARLPATWSQDSA